jgi:hypothetical protein
MKKMPAITIAIFCVCVIGIAIIAVAPFSPAQKKHEQRGTRVIIPRETGETDRDFTGAERMAYEDSINIRLPLNDGETIVAVMNHDFDGDTVDEQVVAYRNLLETESPVYIAYIGYDERGGGYRRLWNAPTAATRPGTVSLYAQDLIGDRNACILLTGMNGSGEHTMTVFRRPSPAESSRPFAKIADLRIDGSITVQETERSQAYQQGIANGHAYTIAAYGHDYESANMLDQMEIIYAFDPANGRYTQSKITRVPGSQIEQRRVRELLSGAPGVFENFINDLWYYVSPQGTVDKSQYIYFDPTNRELIFFGDETQQVFTWQHSNPTRYGLYISSQNISVTTLRRSLDIELESLNSIRIRVFEDVRLKIAVSASWDGSYRRASAAPKYAAQSEQTFNSYIDAVYDSSMGRLRFFRNGVYELSSGGVVTRGRYVFFQVNGQELLEIRAEPEPRGTNPRLETSDGAARAIYHVESASKTAGSGERTDAPGNLSLSRVRLGATGIQDLHEGPITLTPAEG